MAKIRVCPACGHANPPAEMMCENCTALIANIEPLEEAPQSELEPQNPAAGTVRQQRHIRLYDEEGRQVIECPDGSIIGREHVGAEFLSAHMTVSRRHCRIKFTQAGCNVEDLGSMNGTWVNGSRIDGQAKIADNDMLGLSQSLQLRIRL